MLGLENTTLVGYDFHLSKSRGAERCNVILFNVQVNRKLIEIQTVQIMMITLISGLLFILMGLLFTRFYPKKINPFFGYRTPRSMRDQHSWDLAQQYSSREMIRAGIGLCLLSMLGFLFRSSGNMGFLIGLALVVLAIIVMIVRVERKLKKLK